MPMHAMTGHPNLPSSLAAPRGTAAEIEIESLVQRLALELALAEGVTVGRSDIGVWARKR